MTSTGLKFRTISGVTFTIFATLMDGRLLGSAMRARGVSAAAVPLSNGGADEASVSEFPAIGCMVSYSLKYAL
ncbi:hypothetical protein D3093_33820 (plasmid) [Azospirillum argentinense]|uniref:Uncharacterized protein n=1 Tax=Azospirillum argentinense TaxID=2970906 RepID=A0A4D8PWF6_9PROT|nr:hypothetical protein D3093_33820 [Azospirillum argentinense]